MNTATVTPTWLTPEQRFWILKITRRIHLDRGLKTKDAPAATSEGRGQVTWRNSEYPQVVALLLWVQLITMIVRMFEC